MQPLRGIALKLCAVMLFIIMLSLVKAVSADVPAGQSVFFRSFFAIPVIVVWLLLRGNYLSACACARGWGIFGAALLAP